MSEDGLLVERLQGGDEAAFRELVRTYHSRLLRFARTLVPTDQTAEDAVQDTWVAVIRGVERFEQRSSLQTWLFRICANRARTRGGSDSRAIPISSAAPTVSPDHFDTRGAWSDPPHPWPDVDDRLSAKVLAPVALAAIDELPDMQRQVMTLRDIEGMSSKEACQVLSISESNQRVLLHRGRAQVRAVLDAAVRKGLE